jgi:hypothetical protein
MFSWQGIGSAVLLVIMPLSAPAQTHPLNDTGLTTCYNASISTGSVSAGIPDPEQVGFNRQDCTQGRAAADAVGRLYKTGASTRLGADYTRIANNGSELPPTATLGLGPNDWACTRDNLSGLTWEIKVSSAHLRNQNHTYSWYDTNGAVNGGNLGTIGTTTPCGSTLTNCNTTALRNAVNVAGLCGASDWRLPTVDELQSLVHYGVTLGSYIDTTWFPNTAPNFYWSGQNHAPAPVNAWSATFANGFLSYASKNNNFRVRLVRGGP